ncbi:ABC transporter permease [uncultured Dialister sp.]|uniref:ABC transporter permease n=1 Tax=uncultured Dialister sp. TaxID=278064 RepID=UPI0026DACA54|nr:ABC transporter permease [uncultured Dialister sp.]
MRNFLLYAFRRILMLVPFLIGLTILAFALGVLSPGDPAVAVLTMDGSSEPTEAEILAMRHSMGLDRPYWVQYLSWLSGAVTGNLGVSYLTHKPVLDELLRRFPVTLHLALWAMGWVIFLGIPAGVWAAVHEESFREMVLRIFALVFISVPSFWLAIIMMLLFSEELQLLPSSGYGDVVHMILPSFVLAAGTAAATLRLEQASMLETMEKPFVLTERAKGLPEGYIMVHHVLPNSLIPVITMVGTFFGSILGGSVIIENLFSIPGLGSYVLSAIWGRDYPVIQGYVIVGGTVFLVFNYLVDLSYYVLNPKAER